MSTNVMGNRVGNLKVEGDVHEFSNKLGMAYSRSLTQLATCF
jgi:hypothetical protein